MTVKLWSISDLAREMEMPPASIWGWEERGWMPEPYAVATNKNIRLWTDDQVKEIIRHHYNRLLGRDGAKKEPWEKRRIKQHAIEKYTVECPVCDENVFNLKVHNEFAHGGKNAECRK